ncbi:DUF6765 family protein [Corallococcus carmarthensis]|nr:DUF6765 family protein [Corallococcus carmarthensis]
MILSGLVEGAFVGHGRMGHFPDYSWLQFSYEPGWNKKSQNPKLLRDNRWVYLHALMQMIHALRSVRTGEDYMPLELPDMFTWQDLPTSLKECVSERNFSILQEVIAKPPSEKGSHWNYEGAIQEKCGHWERAIMKMGLLRVPDKFERNQKAFEKMGRLEDPLGSHVIRFSIAAKLQYQFLDAFLQQHKKPFLRDFAYGQVAYTEDLVLMNPKKVSSISFVDTAVCLGFFQLLSYQDLSVATLRSALNLRKQLLAAKSKEQQLRIIEKGLEEARYLEASAVSELPMKSDFNVLARVDEKYFDPVPRPLFLDTYKPRLEPKTLKLPIRQVPQTTHWGTGALTTVLKGIGMLLTKRRL